MDLSRNHRDEDYLKKGEAQIYQIQQQVDEVRRLVREQIARQHSVEDNWKQNEARILQMRDVIDRMSSDYTQSIQVRSLEDQRLKQELAEIQLRANEPSKLIRDIRSQLTDLLETRRKETEQTGLDKINLDKLQIGIRDVQSQITRLDGAIRDLREAIKITANAQEFYQRELERLLDLIHNNEQNLVRQNEDYRQQIKELREEVQLFANRITRLEDLQRQDHSRHEEIFPVLDTLRLDDERVMANITRVDRQQSERHTLHQERLEEIRQQLEGQVFSINQIISSHQESNQTRHDSTDERFRGIEAGILALQLRIEQFKQVEDSEIFEIYQMEEMRISRAMESLQAEFDMVRQHRAKSQAGGLQGKRAARARRAREAEMTENNPSGDDGSI
jgi:chromosome segregation ATPase